jgi:hypothetical protein
MLSWIGPAHHVLAIVLLVLYALLSYRLWTKSEEELTSLESTLIQTARLLLLVIYLTGAILSINMGVHVARIHHWVSLTPVLILFFFQFLPGLLRKGPGTRFYAIMFLLMALTIIAISITGTL